MFTWLRFQSRQGWPDGQLQQVLAPFTRRVSLRYTLETLRLALTWGLAVAAALLAFLHWTPFPAVRIAAAAGGVVAGLVSGWRWLRRPDALTVVKLADDLGLGGGAITAFRLLQAGASGGWPRAALAEGLSACQGLRDDKYPLIPSWPYWRGIAILLGVFTGLALTPNPLLPYWEERRTEKAALTAAANEVARIVKPLPELAREGEPFLPDFIRRELAALERTLREAGDRQEGAAVLQRASQELDQVAAELSPSRQEAAKLAALWQEQQGAGWQQLARSLARGDAGAARQAADDLWSQISRLPAGSAEAREAALSLWRGAEATGRPELRQALRDAAAALTRAGSQAGSGDGRPNGDTAAFTPGGKEDTSALAMAGQALAAALADLAETARAGAGLMAAAGGLEQLAHGLASGYPAAMLASGGAAVAAGNTSAVTGSGSAGSGAEAGSGRGEPGVDDAAGRGDPPAGGQGTANAQGSGDAYGGNGGSSPGDSFNGQGTGTGPGGQGRGGGGAGTGGGGVERIYTPFLPGGEGPASRVNGTLRPGEAGMEVSQPWSPVVVGTVRPYDEVYPTYVTRARETVARAPLPPPLETLVWQYFSAIEPGQGNN